MTLSALIERLEKATGPDRELDFWIWWWAVANGGSNNAEPPADYVRSNIKMNDAPLYTASINAAVNLYEMLFSGWQWELSRKAARAIKPNPAEGEEYRWTEIGANAAIALCLATLRARASIAKETA